MNCYLTTNSLVDATGTRSCYIKKSELWNWIKLADILSLSVLYVPSSLFELPTTKFCTVYLSNSRKHVIFGEAVVHIARVGERLPRLQIHFRISRSFRPRNLENLGSKSVFGFAERNTPLISRQKCPPITLLLLFDQTAVSLADLNTCYNLHQKLLNAKLTFSLTLPTGSGKSLIFWELLQVIDHAHITSYPANNTWTY